MISFSILVEDFPSLSRSNLNFTNILCTYVYLFVISYVAKGILGNKVFSYTLILTSPRDLIQNELFISYLHSLGLLYIKLSLLHCQLSWLSSFSIYLLNPCFTLFSHSLALVFLSH